MKRLFLNNLGWKILSVAIAVALWFAMFGGPRYQTSVSAPVQFSHAPQDLEINADRPQVVTLEVRGPSRLLEWEDLSKIVVLLDLASVQKPGERVFSLTAGDVSLPAGVDFVRAVPSEIRLRFDRPGSPPEKR